MHKCLVFLLLAFHVSNLHAQNCNEVSVYFKPKKYSLTSLDLAEIKKTIASIQPLTFQSVHIEGFSDSTGTEKANAVLSQKRIDAALCAIKPLIDTSVRIKMINWGESHPLSSTDLNKNRCVKITFVLDTLINIADKGKGEIWLNTNSLSKPDLCNSNITVSEHIYTKSYSYSSIPISNTSNLYYIQIANTCMDVYYFPKAFYNPVTRIGKFPRPIYIAYCSTRYVDSLDFSIYASEFQYDSISEGYYLISKCGTCKPFCCGTRPNCLALVFVPEETSAHKTFLTHYNFRSFEDDTLFASDSLLWNNWQCDSFDHTDSIYSIAVFNSAYYYLTGKIGQYGVYDSLVLNDGRFLFEMNEKKYYDTSASRFFLLKRDDYKSFSSPTNKRLIIKVPRGYTPGYYVKEYDVVVPFEHVRGKKYKGYAIDYPTEFGLQRDDTILQEKELAIKRKVKKSKTVIRLTFPKEE